MNLSILNLSMPIHSRPRVTKKPETQLVAASALDSNECTMDETFSASSSCTRGLSDIQ
jgi:hypothetical protein